MRAPVPLTTLIATVAVGLSACAATAISASDRTSYDNRPCSAPKGHAVTDCRVALHGAPDLSRRAFLALTGGEVSITSRIRGLAPNAAAGGARDWPLVDSLEQPMGRLSADDAGRLTLTDTAGTTYRVALANIRGHGCAADPTFDRTHPLIQIVALKARASGTQAFIDRAALDQSTPDGLAAFRAFATQQGGGTGCGPARPERGGLRPLVDPNVGARAHARLGNGELNTVTEYDAKPEFGNVLYFSSNTTEVHAGGIARGMVKVGTKAATVDTMGYCDPNSDGTLLWRYVSIRTGAKSGRQRLYGWIPSRCPARLKDVRPPR